jgi:hydrogenase nickel incorporation protein HypA/HybF
MHELGIAEQMVRTALDYAARNHAARIARFNIEMSSAADESEDSLRFHFENLTRGTIGQDAKVEIRRVAIRKKCFDCSTEFEWSESQHTCPHCASARARAIPQDEFKLVSIDVE